jgi:hypothetical protein
MPRSSLVVAAAAIALLSPLVLAQAPAPTPPTAGAVAPTKATAFILGQVLDGSTGEPIADAVVTLRTAGGGRGTPPRAGGAGDAATAVMATAQMQTATGRSGAAEQRLMTGGDGRFIFHSLPPGNYTIAATLSGYSSTLSTDLSNVSALPALAGLSLPMGGPDAPTSISLTEGQRVSDFRTRLWKHAAITGVVVDDGGEPAIGLVVQAMRRMVVAGRARYFPMMSGRTDDRGMFRIASLRPGDYIVVIPQAPAAVPAAMMEGVMKGVLGGGDMSALMGFADLAFSGINVDAAMQSGVRIGSYMVASASGAPPILAADGRLFVYQTAFYPGATVPANAEAITLESGEEHGGVDFQLRLTPTVRVSGVASGPTGPMANLGMRLVVPADGVTSDSEFDVATVVTGHDGSFTFFGVPPGQFLLRAEKEARPDMAQGAMIAMMGMGRGGAPPVGPAKSVFGQVSVQVGTTDLDGVRLQLVEGVTVAGRVEFTSASGRAAPSTTSMQVQLVPADGRMPTRFGGGSRSRASNAGTVESTEYGPGRYFVTVSDAPPPWQVKTVTMGGRDVLDAPLDLRETVTSLRVTMTDEEFTLSGLVTATGGQSAADAIVYAFPADHRAWIESGMNPRRSRSTRVSTNGRYTFGILPPGDYLAVAVDRSGEGNLQDPAYIDVLSRAATRVTVTNPQQTLDLTTVRIKR